MDASLVSSCLEQTPQELLVREIHGSGLNLCWSVQIPAGGEASVDIREYFMSLFTETCLTKCPPKECRNTFPICKWAVNSRRFRGSRSIR